MNAQALAWPAAVLCVLGLVGTLAGSWLGALLFLLAGAAAAAPAADAVLRMLGRAPGLWLLPALAGASVLWSAAPMVTLRAAVQLALTVGIAALVAGLLRPRGFASAMCVALLAGAVASLGFGRFGIDGMTGETVFLGIFASKNTMALFMSLLAIFAAAVMLDRGQPGVLRLVGLLSFLLAVPLLLMARSAGALVTTVASLGVLVLTAVVARLDGRERAMLAAGAAVILLPAAAVVAGLAMAGTLGEAASAFITEVLGKDTTLTGRTLLWRTAWAEIGKQPLLGVGYYAFWLQGNPLVESIWRDFGIHSRMGFHFHNTPLNLAVELGWTGTAALAVTFALALLRTLRLALASRDWGSAALVAALACLAARSMGEVDAPYPFAIGTFVLFAAAAYGAGHARVAAPGLAPALPHGAMP